MGLKARQVRRIGALQQAVFPYGITFCTCSAPSPRRGGRDRGIDRKARRTAPAAETPAVRPRTSFHKDALCPIPGRRPEAPVLRYVLARGSIRPTREALLRMHVGADRSWHVTG